MLYSMTKYNIEGGLDFYSELYGGLDIPESDGQHENICLITNKPLIDLHVKMNCGHTFNYEPLYKDLVNHKMKFNNMEGSTGMLGKNEIRCPYCRAKQKEILPYYPQLGLIRVEGINTASIPPQKCSFVWDNKDYDEKYPEDFINPKTIKCTHIGSNVINDGVEDILYCAKHNKYVLTQQAKALKEKEKQEKIAIKLKLKEDAALTKASAKIVAKADKALAKANADAKGFIEGVTGENAVIATNISIPIEFDPYLCVEILKTGDRKGQQCSIHMIPGKDRCRRHYNLLVKNNL
jgi:hypothetical protein